MAKLISNFPKIADKVVKDVIKKESLLIVKKQLEDTLFNNRTADNNVQPTKAPSTKKIYAKEGWDQNNWLVRTGESTKLIATYSSNSIEIVPKGQSLLQSKLYDTASDWFKISEETKDKIFNKIKEGLKDA